MRKLAMAVIFILFYSASALACLSENSNYFHQEVRGKYFVKEGFAKKFAFDFSDFIVPQDIEKAVLRLQTQQEGDGSIFLSANGTKALDYFWSYHSRKKKRPNRYSRNSQQRKVDFKFFGEQLLY